MEKKISSRSMAKTASSRKLLEPPVTEKPAMPSIQLTSQYVVTVNNVTGLPERIEKLDEATGEQTELSEEEYTQCLGCASPGIYSDMVLTQAQLNYQALTDYMNMLNGRSS